MRLADRGLNLQAQELEEAQTSIRFAVLNGWFTRRSKKQINAHVQKVISSALKNITIPDLRSAGCRSLNAFAERQYATLIRSFGSDPTTVVAIAALANAKGSIERYGQAAETVKNAMLRDGSDGVLGTRAHGSPLQMYSKDYFDRRIVPVLDGLAEQQAIDPDDVDARNSLRNRAEMEVRYAHHQAEISGLRAAGVKLVTSSVHADCSNRCYEWQGRVYSLDGTTGVTEDGKRYVPLEVATDVYYTTRAGKVYKNGLFGFNCRHYLMAYQVGMVIPQVSKETQQRERAINARQRELEARVRELRIKALTYKDIDRERYLRFRREAISANKEYEQFSRDNDRAFYRSRVKLV